MPEVIRGSRTRSFENTLSQQTTPSSPLPHDRRVTFGQGGDGVASNSLTSVTSDQFRPSTGRRSKSFDRTRRSHRASVERVERDAYYDSRAATKREFRRRASTLQSYYKEHPHLLPQLPFTFRHGFKRWKLGAYIGLMVIDACVVPIVLYYAMTFAGNVQGWIIFAIVATVWGGPTYIEFAVRSWRLIKKEHFFRPLGATSRWGFDITHWILVLTITTVTALLVVGSAPHIVFIRVLSMPGPGILYALSVPTLIITIFHMSGAKAPFRLSSTPKGGKVLPGVYYLIEDIVAVNAAGGRPFREGLAARYDASPIFRKMLRDQSLFWSIPAFAIAVACTVVVCVHTVPKAVGYGIGWGVPFLFLGVWAAITVPWVRATMHRETVDWESDNDGLGIVPSTQMTPGPLPVTHGNEDDLNYEKDPDGNVPELRSPARKETKEKDGSSREDSEKKEAREAGSDNSSAPTAVDVTAEQQHPEKAKNAQTEKEQGQEQEQQQERPEKIELPPQSPGVASKLHTNSAAEEEHVAPHDPVPEPRPLPEDQHPSPFSAKPADSSEIPFPEPSPMTKSEG